VTLPPWAEWRADPALPPYTVGLEEEVMLLDPRRLALEHRIDDVLAELSPWLGAHVGAETHGCTLELATGVCETVGDAVAELAALRARLASELHPLGLRAAVAGTHPTAVWHETRVSTGARYRLLSESLRELARREPTFALHVHVGLPDPATAVRVCDRLRAHLPLVLALSANSPYWQGRDSGLASARTPLFQAFPRVGIPRRFGTYDRYVAAIDVLLRAGAFPEPTFVWWDVRLQPRLGTVEVRIADAQTRVEDTAAIAAIVQAVAKLEAEEGAAPDALLAADEVLAENRFLAARDGVAARLVDPVTDRLVCVREQLDALLEAAEPHARELGCAFGLDAARALAERPGADRQRAVGGEGDLKAVVAALAEGFAPGRDAAPLCASADRDDLQAPLAARGGDDGHVADALVAQGGADG
jgi:carboxylate-amine ligase